MMRRCGCHDTQVRLQPVDGYDVEECVACGATWMLYAERTIWLADVLSSVTCPTCNAPLTVAPKDNAIVIIPDSAPLVTP